MKKFGKLHYEIINKIYSRKNVMLTNYHEYDNGLPLGCLGILANRLVFYRDFSGRSSFDGYRAAQFLWLFAKVCKAY